jgi:hypothetical protein
MDFDPIYILRDKALLSVSDYATLSCVYTKGLVPDERENRR